MANLLALSQNEIYRLHNTPMLQLITTILVMCNANLSMIQDWSLDVMKNERGYNVK